MTILQYNNYVYKTLSDMTLFGTPLCFAATGLLKVHLKNPKMFCVSGGVLEINPNLLCVSGGGVPYVRKSHVIV